MPNSDDFLVVAKILVAKDQNSCSVWNPWWSEDPVWTGQSMEKYWRNTLKTADSSQWITCPPRFGFLKGEFYKEKTCSTRKRLGLQGNEARPHYYKSPNTPSHQGTHNWPLSNTLELWEYFWLNLRRVFGRLHTGAFCKVFLFSSHV